MFKKIVFLFSGQGSQYYWMGKELFGHCSTFRRWMLNLDALVFQKIGTSIINEIYNEEKKFGDAFERTLFTHPAIFMVEYSLAQVLLEAMVKPDYVCGVSLGEFTAAAVSGVMGVEDGIDWILKQAETFESHCQKGSMLAILHSPNLYSEIPSLFRGTEIASINYDTHFVISGATGRLEEISAVLKDQGVISQRLPVSFGFHSSYIDPAQEEYIRFLRGKSFNKPALALISSLTGEQLSEIPEDYFWKVVREPIRFQKPIQELEERVAGCIYIDLGPSGTLANFTKKNLSQDSNSQCYPIITPFNQELKNIKAINDLLFGRTF